MLLAPLALALGATIAAHGGFFPRGQIAFAVLAATAAVAALALSGEGAAAALRSPAVLVLLGLAALSAASAAWTIAEPEDALRWGAVLAGYGLLALASLLVAMRLGPLPPATLIALAAIAAGLVGLYGAGARVEPLAQRLGGQWSPGGPLEYSPALGLAQVSALPVLLLAAARARPRGWALPAGAAGLAVAGASLALVGSRVQLALGLAVVAALVAWPAAALGDRRLMLIAGAALAVTAGGLADAVAGSYVRPYETGGDAPRLLGLAAIVCAAPALWALQRRLLERGEPGGRPRTAALAAVIAPAAAALALAAATPDSGPQAEPISGFTHGRAALWEAATDTALDRPLEGSGALSFLEASLPHQDPPPVRFAHNLPLEVWAELGAAGALGVLLLYALSVRLVLSGRRGGPSLEAAWLLGPAVAGFLVANLFDWPWHVPASGALFAVALGGLAGSVGDGGWDRSEASLGHDSG